MRWNNKEVRTFEDLLNIMEAIYDRDDQDDATSFMLDYLKENPNGRENIGYLTGYFDNETMLGMQSLFKVAHPVFGYKQIPTPEEAFKLGTEIVSIKT